jgi:pimeloyl-ACP methyl ester carboxylesterase
MGGVPITLAGEMAPEKIKKIVYLAAFMPESNVPTAAYLGRPEQQDSPMPALGIGNPEAIGTVRLDPRSTDPAYRSAMKKSLYGDVDDGTIDMVAQFLTPDFSIQQAATPVKTTAGRWGSIKRTYIMTTEDWCVRPALQKLFIDKADAFVPQNKTEVISIKSSHSPFLSKPEELADILSALAGK